MKTVFCIKNLIKSTYLNSNVSGGFAFKSGSNYEVLKYSGNHLFIRDELMNEFGPFVLVKENGFYLFFEYFKELPNDN